MATKEIQEKIVANMKRWQKIENASVSSTGQIIEKTDNPIVRLIMEIIQRDSQMHYRVQEFIVDSLESKTISLNPDELAQVWDKIETHIELEKETIRIAKETLETMKGKKMIVQEYLLNYLMIDEDKHNEVLDKLESIKKGMYPYG
jgi:hypothetical protein